MKHEGTLREVFLWPMNWLVLRRGRLVLSRRRVMAVSGVAVFGDYLVCLTRRAPAPHFRVFRALFGVFRVPGGRPERPGLLVS